ncbi:MAG: hypothetical protein IT376_21515 [Polyangiaceae bacterium]|nr:hypothetical protein [Polyangiaceae bacterium]
MTPARDGASRRARWRRQAAICWATGLLGVGCGARAPEAGPSAPGGGSPRAAPATEPAPTPPPPSPAATAPPEGMIDLDDEKGADEPAPEETPSGGLEPDQADAADGLATALGAFRRAEAALAAQLAEAPGRDRCELACRALGSLERSADRICQLDGGGPRCRAARDRVADARARVRAACGACP